jgi:spore germination protein GerM
VKGRGLLAFVLLCVVVSACAVGTDEAPRDIEQATVLVRDTNDDAQAAGGAGRIYLTVPGVSGEPTRLRSVARDVGDDPDAVVAALLAGPNGDEFTDQLRTALPDGLQVITLQRRAGGIVDLDVTDEIQQLSGDVQVLALAQIVYTVSELNGIEAVRISVDGESVQWPDGNGELTIGPLTVYDFPGLEPTAQPAYPAVPSNEPIPASTDTSTSDPVTTDTGG